jgi:hypothetical protein
MPSFCSECGERLKTKRAGLWPSRARCYHCDPGFRRGRLLLSGLLVLSLGAGFVVGRYTRRPEPFYFIGTPTEPRSLPLVSSAEKGNQERPPARAEVQRGAGGPVESICGASTRSGKPCQRRVRGGGYCWQHRGKDPKW